MAGKSLTKTLNNMLIILFILCHHTMSMKINNLGIPIEWHEVALSSEHTSMSTIIDSSGDIYLCGGKTSLYSKSSKCIRITVEKLLNNYLITQTFSGGNGIQSSGEYEGLYFKVKSFTCSTQNEGGIYNNRLCMLSVSDGSNQPKSWCCDITSFKCNDLRYSIINSYPERFESCVIHDTIKNMLYQIGGYYGQTIFDTILCFDLQTETYLNNNECNYGNLNKPIYSLGCTILPNDKYTIITVGGLDTLSISSSTTYISHINICNSDKTTCKQFPILNEGIISKTRVFAIDGCHVGIVGGMIININGLETVSS
eukprot:474972_1